MNQYVNNSNQFTNIIGVVQPPTVLGTSQSYSQIVGPVQAIYPLSDICFPAGTSITTNQGVICIDKIDTTIHTIRNKKIMSITKTISQDKHLILFKENSLGPNIPNKPTMTTENHMIFYNKQMIPAAVFVDNFINVTKIPYTGEPLYNVLLENHDKMIVNNLICETLSPEHPIAKLYKILPNFSAENQMSIIKSLNDSILYKKEGSITFPTLA